ncbi:hypothetical protein D3C72_2079830 [compost metagenome]
MQKGADQQQTEQHQREALGALGVDEPFLLMKASRSDQRICEDKPACQKRNQCPPKGNPDLGDDEHHEPG